MALKPTIYRSRLYRDFKAISSGDFRRKVHFYERHEKNIMHLDFEEYFEMLYAYTNALFEIGEWRKHLLMVDCVIQTSISENIVHISGEEIFCSSLFKKAASHYNLKESEQAQYVLKELIKIEPEYPLSKKLLEYTLRDEKPQIIKQARAVAIFLFLMAALIICIEVLLIRNYYEMYTRLVEISRNSMFLMGVLTLVIGFVFQKIWIFNRLKKILSNS